MSTFRIITQFTQGLKSLDAILGQAESYAAEHHIDPSELLKTRLAADMFDLTTQVRITSDTARFTAARLSGKTAPSVEDDETTFSELRARLQDAISYLNTFTEADFSDSATREVTLPFAKDFYSPGEAYLFEFAMPNFYFHLTTAYGLVRHKGVPIGKRDFIGHMTMLPKKQG